MTAHRRLSLYSLGFAIALGAVAGDALAQSGNLDYCARPVAPVCVEDDETYANDARREACATAVQLYNEMTFAYRKCLASQIDSEMRSANKVNERFTCRVKGGRKCP